MQLLFLFLFAIPSALADCCSGSGPSLPSNTAASCVSSSSGAMAAAWTLVPSCATGTGCIAYKCTLSSAGVSMVQYGQQCSTPTLMDAAVKATQAALVSSGMTGSCSTMIGAASAHVPSMTLVLAIMAAVCILVNKI